MTSMPASSSLTSISTSLVFGPIVHTIEVSLCLFLIASDNQLGLSFKFLCRVAMVEVVESHKGGKEKVKRHSKHKEHRSA